MTDHPDDIPALELASLLCSRLCHDLLSPVGAINNGLELLAEETDPDMRARCLDLLNESANTSANKLKFFRLAFGAAGAFGDRVDAKEPRDLITGLIGGNERITLEWVVNEPLLPKPAVKVLLNLALIGIDALVRGGTLVVGAEVREGEVEIVVRANGPRVIVDAGVEQAMRHELPASEITPRTAPAYMVERLASHHNGALQVVRDDSVLIMGVILAV